MFQEEGERETNFMVRENKTKTQAEDGMLSLSPSRLIPSTLLTHT